MDDSLYYKRTIVKERIASAALGEERSLRIYLPPGYNELLSYPVIYCQDGEDFFNFGRIATAMNRLIYDDNVEPAIIVGVDVDKSIRTSEYAPEGSRFAAYCLFFAEELVPFLENHYPVRAELNERIIAGDSLGGTVSLHLALNYPSLFCKVISLSGAFLQSTQNRIANEDDLSWLQLSMLIGTDETEVQTERGVFDLLEANRKTKQLLEARSCLLKYEEKPGKHLWGFWQNELPGMLKPFLM
ncbi:MULTISPECIES: alpha/beta hydrolase-fold protein [unclassified Paenibacillus]|uniref:alpha/beta hydrolase n=1 Tax=unclassified Paenibacillus TaxID=185978 RepID=UPI001AE73507|nr:MULTISPECIES: alpha/beta hydrolase-fold protein [unclassified Paenibacillus]MBP1156503.1 enterochelin esterase-like enzyme [Paenibacillus sp. PvP091]MBP1168111.1 enterochelin esterase-like enzyme [Paenibacillus sp. PvR098]MBP2439139.1 enterochelin esterase-like enzyme [Paenibacillus sp. PvP052]